MKRLLIILVVIAGCTANQPLTPVADLPDGQSAEQVPAKIDTPPPDNTTLTPQETNVSTPPALPEEEPEIEMDPQLDAKLTVDAYLDFMTQALDGDDNAFEEAYKLISPHSKKNLFWMGNLERFKLEAADTYEKYDNGKNITGWLKNDEFGGAYRVYYSFDDSEVYYITQIFDGLYYIASGSKPGSMFWRFTAPE